jgi:signal transduction histidine kinase
VDADEFDQEDEEALARFATVAAMAIENAVLHHQVQVLAVTQERERIAREMHDSLAQVLGYVNTKAQAAQALLDRGEDERASAQIGQLAEAARAAYADVREDILALRTSLGDPDGFVGPLRQYLERWQDQSGVRVRLIEPPADEPLPAIDAIAEVQLLRIVQESLANVRKHAKAEHVEIRLGAEHDALVATVHDDGTGFDPARLGRSDFPRFGLSTMRERAEGVGGALDVASTPGEGTSVTVRIPAAAAVTTRRGASLARTHR